MCQLITAATYLLKRNNSDEDAYSTRLNWIKHIESDEVSWSIHLQFSTCTLEKFLQSGRQAALFHSNLWPGGSITREGFMCKMLEADYEPADPESHKTLLCQELYTQIQTVNIQINGKPQKTSPPKLEAEITRAIVPIHLSSKKQGLVSTELHRELKNQELWQRSPLQKVKKRQSSELVPVLGRRCGVCEVGGKLNPIWWIWETNDPLHDGLCTQAAANQKTAPAGKCQLYGNVIFIAKLSWGCWKLQLSCINFHPSFSISLSLLFFNLLTFIKIF